VRRDEAAARLQQATHQGRGDAERWIGDDVVWLTGQAQAAGVGLDDHDRATEALAEVLGSLGVGFDGDDPGTGGDQRKGECSMAGADIDDDGAPTDARLSDEPLRPAMVELVPPPSPP